MSGGRVYSKKDYNTRTKELRTVVVSPEAVVGLSERQQSSTAPATGYSDRRISTSATILTLYGLDVPTTSPDDDERHDLVDEFALLSKGMREREMIHLSAAHIAALFRVGLPRRSVRLPNRDELIERVESYPAATRDDLRDGFRGETPTGSIATLFTNLDEDSVATIIQIDPLASQALARSALTPTPPPRIYVVKSLKRDLSPLVGGVRQSSVLVNAYVDIVAEVTESEFSPNASQGRIKTAEERIDDYHRWEDVVKAVVKKGHTSLGYRPHEVLCSVSARARSIAVERARALM
jgi:hypothetical protein